MSAPPSPGLQPRPQVDYEQGYSEDQENWSDDPSNGQDEPEVPSRKTRRHVLPSRVGIPGGETVRYGHRTPRQEYRNPFSSAPGLGPRPYYTSGQQYPTPAGGFPQDSGYYSAGQYGTSYIPAPHSQPNHYSQHPYHPNISMGQPPFDYAPPYQPPASQQFRPPVTDRPPGIRLPSLRLRTSRQENAARERETDEQRWRERSRQRERERKETEKKQREREKKEAEKKQREREKKEVEKKQREREKKEVEKKQREREKKEVEKKQREREESDRAQWDKLKFEVQALQRQLELERSTKPASAGGESTMKVLMDYMYLHGQREQENQRRWIETRPDPVVQLLQNLVELADTRRVDPYQHERLQWLGGISPKPGPPTRSDFSHVSYDTAHRSRLEEIIMDVLSRMTASDEQEKDRLPLPPPSPSTTRPAREYYHTDSRSPRGPPPEWQDEEGGAASPRPRFGDAPGDFDDAYRHPSSPRHRVGNTPGMVPSAPEFERRQAAAPANSSSKRARGSDFSSEYTSAAERGDFPIPESQDALPRRTESGRRGEPRSESHRSPGRRSSHPGPRPAAGQEIPRGARNGSRNSTAGHAVSFENREGLMSGRPTVDTGVYDLSGSDTEDGAPRQRRTRRPYRFTGEKVPGCRYNPRDARVQTPPPEVPDVPRSEAAERAWRAAGGPVERSPRRVARVDSWSDDEQEERRNVGRSPSAMGR